jgi:hypothetical protein
MISTVGKGLRYAFIAFPQWGHKGASFLIGFDSLPMSHLQATSDRAAELNRIAGNEKGTFSG